MKLNNFINKICVFAQTLPTPPSPTGPPPGPDSALYAPKVYTEMNWDAVPDGERPHGYETPDPHIEIADEGVIHRSEFYQKFGYVDESVSNITQRYKRRLYDHGAPKINGLSPLKTKPEKEDDDWDYVAYMITNVSAKWNEFWDMKFEGIREHVYFHNGWTSSYHDASWSGQNMMFALGKTPEDAQQRLHAAASQLMKDDPVKRRFELRRLVRPGD